MFILLITRPVVDLNGLGIGLFVREGFSSNCHGENVALLEKYALYTKA
ncbi:hypothetical protein [uncultured Shewanella sp.]|nr:hypothetical protein [uncultured Shewanella sp.]